MSELARWAEDIVFRTWTKYKNSWPLGIRIFYSPVQLNPPLMIISLQPGGKEEDFKIDKQNFEKEIFTLPLINSYAEEDYPLAGKMRALVDNSLLQRSIVLPAIFFRSPSASSWRSVAGSSREEMENFSLREVGNIIEKLDPQRLLIVGFQTHGLLKELLEPIEKTGEVLHRSKGNGRLALPFTSKGREGVVIIHPTGARISAGDSERIKDLLQRKFKT